jgi:hypothetical protein
MHSILAVSNNNSRFPTKETHIMAKDETRRLKPSTLISDRDSVAALQAVTGYNPANQSFTQAALNTLKTALDTAQAA